MDVGYLGPEGTYTQEAAQVLVRKLKLDGARLLPLESIDAVLSAINANAIIAGVVPLRNTLAGDYQETVQGLLQYTFKRTSSITLPIKLAFGVHPEASDELTEIRSKDTALRECTMYLERNYPRAACIEVVSTAAAMQEIMRQRLLHAAAIGSRAGMNLYGLHILDDDVGNSTDNFTEFLYLQKV